MLEPTEKAPARPCQQPAMRGGDLCRIHANPAEIKPLTDVPERRRCTATASSGEPCKRWSMAYQDVCGAHGGKAPQNRAAANRRKADAEVDARARRLWARIDATPVDNPLLALQQVAGEVLAFKDACAGMVNQLQEIRYQGAAGEQLRAEIVLYERAMDRAGNFLAKLAQLNIDERLAAISERQAEAVIGAIEAALAYAGITGETRVKAKQVAARRLRIV
ncbi:hypothetical protein [Streptomyces sp. NPDC059994]|uniref:hypothetical protein n=1 Tax=Streptomyces sp. NPDC059994 TaxID=3347029 RepID=UPI0036B97800